MTIPPPFLELEFEIDPAVKDPAQLEAHRAELDRRLSALSEAQSVSSDTSRPMGGLWGAIVEITPHLKETGEAIGGVAGLLIAVRKLYAELKIWREAYIRVDGKRKQLDAITPEDIAALTKSSGT